MWDPSIHLLSGLSVFADTPPHVHPFQDLASLLAHSYKECFVFLSNRYEISQSTPFETQRPRWHPFPSPIEVEPPHPPSFRGPVSLLAHRLVSTFLGDLASSLAHPYKKWFVFLSNHCGISHCPSSRWKPRSQLKRELRHRNEINLSLILASSPPKQKNFCNNCRYFEKLSCHTIKTIHRLPNIAADQNQIESCRLWHWLTLYLAHIDLSIWIWTWLCASSRDPKKRLMWLADSAVHMVGPVFLPHTLIPIPISLTRKGFLMSRQTSQKSAQVARQLPFNSTTGFYCMLLFFCFRCMFVF